MIKNIFDNLENNDECNELEDDIPFSKLTRDETYFLTFRNNNVSLKEIDKEIQYKIHTIIDELLKFYSRGVNYGEDGISWKLIAFSILHNPKGIIFDYDNCPICNSKRVNLKYYERYSQPPFPYLYKGVICLCLNCKTQDFHKEERYLK